MLAIALAAIIKQKIVVLRKPIADGIHPLPNVKMAAFKLLQIWTIRLQHYQTTN